MIQLQPETEDVLRFLEGGFSKQDGVISTGSRMQLIVDSVKELVLYASGDVAAQLDQLHREKYRIESKISALEQNQEGEQMDDREVNERFYMIDSMLRDLMGDFRGVEQKFRDIVQGLREREIASVDMAGDLLGYVLDAEDELREHPHGASFYAFVNFVLSGERRDQFDELVAELRSLDALASNPQGLDRLDGMVPLLTDEAAKILNTTQRLSAALRRLLDPRASEEHRRLRESLQGNLHDMASLRLPSNNEDIWMEIDLAVQVDSPMSRDFWEPVSSFTQTELLTVGDDAEEKERAEQEHRRRNALADYAALKRLDWKRMSKQINTMLKSRSEVGLKDLLGGSELSAGMVEVLGYIQLAHDGSHIIDPSSPEILRVEIDGQQRRIEVPSIKFIKHAKVQQKN